MLSTLMSYWRGGNFTMLDIVFLLLSFAVLIFVSLPVHEWAHAFMAHKLGDDTAKYAGRLTLNPLKHLDTFGTIMMLVCGFGYAKPVPVNAWRFRNPKNGMALTSLAGPLSNLAMAILAVGLFRVSCLIFGVQFRDGSMYASEASIEIMRYLYVFFIQILASINISLAVFNLLPIPPLDGSRLFAAVLPDRWSDLMYEYERYITMGLFVLLLTGALDVPLSFLRRGFGLVVCTLFGMPNVL